MKLDVLTRASRSSLYLLLFLTACHGSSDGSGSRFVLLIDEDGDGTPASADCDDADPNRFDALEFAATDLDRDEHFTPAAGVLCTNGTLPAGYSDIALENAFDCDDNDYSVWRVAVVYLDLDNDGVGSGEGVPACIGDTAPARRSLLGFDPFDSPTDPNSRKVSDFDLPPYLLATPEP